MKPVIKMKIIVNIAMTVSIILLMSYGLIGEEKHDQEWLGHSDFSTTANIYAHLDCSSKLISADAMLNGLGMDSK